MNKHPRPRRKPSRDRDPELLEYAARLRQAWKESGMTQMELLQAMGLNLNSTGKMSKWLNGVEEMPRAYVERFAEATGGKYLPHWLAWGTGPRTPRELVESDQLLREVVGENTPGWVRAVIDALTQPGVGTTPDLDVLTRVVQSLPPAVAARVMRTIVRAELGPSRPPEQ
jgi:transcriptional regulator with XRE-family HTH domain